MKLLFLVFLVSCIFFNTYRSFMYLKKNKIDFEELFKYITDKNLTLSNYDYVYEGFLNKIKINFFLIVLLIMINIIFK